MIIIKYKWSLKTIDLLELDLNTWNTVHWLFVLDRNTRYHIIVYKNF